MVHPKMLLKTREVSGIRCQVSGNARECAPRKNDVPSRNVYENKKKVSGVRCKVSGRGPRSSTRKENDVPSRNVYENKEKKVSGVRYKVPGVRKGPLRFLGLIGHSLRPLRSASSYTMYNKSTLLSRCEHACQDVAQGRVALNGLVRS